MYINNNKFFRISERYIDDLSLLTKQEYRALFSVILFSSVEFTEHDILKMLHFDFGIDLSNKISKDVKEGLKHLIDRNLLSKIRNGKYYLNTEILNLGIYNLRSNSSSDKKYIKMYLSYTLVDMIKKSSKLDFNLAFSLLKDITYFKDCVNVVNINKKRKDNLCNQFNVSIYSVNKGLMNLKEVGFLRQAPSKSGKGYSKNKFIVSPELIYKGTEEDKEKNYRKVFNKDIDKFLCLNAIEGYLYKWYSYAKDEEELLNLQLTLNNKVDSIIKNIRKEFETDNEENQYQRNNNETSTEYFNGYEIKLEEDRDNIDEIIAPK